MEFGRLTAVFDADTSRFEAGGKKVTSSIASMTRDTGRLSDVFRGLSVSTAALDGPLGGISGRLSSVGSLMTGLTTSAGAVGIALGAFTTITIGATIAAVKFTTSIVSGIDALGDMAEKVNFSVRTISGLKPAIDASGGSLEGFTTALGIFDKNIEAVAQGSERLGKLFKALNIDATDNEKAFRQVAEILVKLGGTSQQTALAMELFGRSGKDVLGVIKETGGNVDAFIQKMEALGVVVGDDAVAAADDFDRHLVLVSAQLDAVQRQLAMELLPLVQQGAKNISTWLNQNQGEIRRTINEVGNLLNAIRNLAQYIRYVTPIILVTEVVVRTIYDKATPGPGAGPGGGAGLVPIVPGSVYAPAGGAAKQPSPTRWDVEGEMATPFGSATPASGQTADTALADRIRQLLNRGGGSGGGRGGAARDALADLKRSLETGLRSTLETLQAEEDGVRRSYEKRRLVVGSYFRAISRLEENRHKEILTTLDEETKLAQKIKDPAERKFALEDLGLRKIEEANRHRQASWKLEDDINGATRERIALVDTLIQRLTREREVLKEIAQERFRFASEVARQDLGGGSIVLTPELRDRTGRPRIATVERQVEEERLQIIRERMRGLASDLTSILDRAIYDGVEGGLKRGFQSFLVGALQSILRIAMQRMENELANALSSVASRSSGGGGGWFGSLISPILGAIAGGFGGGVSTGGLSSGALSGGFAGAFETGGRIPMGQWGIVHDNEKVIATPTGTHVIPAMNGRGATQPIINNHYTINLPPENRGNYSTPRSKRQLSETLIAALQATQS